MAGVVAAVWALIAPTDGFLLFLNAEELKSALTWSESETPKRPDSLKDALPFPSLGMEKAEGTKAAACIAMSTKLKSPSNNFQLECYKLASIWRDGKWQLAVEK